MDHLRPKSELLVRAMQVTMADLLLALFLLSLNNRVHHLVAQTEKCEQFVNGLLLFALFVFDGKRSEMHEMHERSGTSHQN